jgi:hypothetical protein
VFIPASLKRKKATPVKVDAKPNVSAADTPDRDPQNERPDLMATLRKQLTGA